MERKCTAFLSSSALFFFLPFSTGLCSAGCSWFWWEGKLIFHRYYLTWPWPLTSYTASLINQQFCCCFMPGAPDREDLQNRGSSFIGLCFFFSSYCYFFVLFLWLLRGWGGLKASHTVHDHALKHVLQLTDGYATRQVYLPEDGSLSLKRTANSCYTNLSHHLAGKGRRNVILTNHGTFFREESNEI